jgi:TRAP-type C4-dicarboxylate transport system permease small subunit
MSETTATRPRGGLVDRVGETLTQFTLAIAAVSLLSIVAVNGANVVARYLFRSPFPWAEELMLFMMILAVFAGAIAVTWRNVHIRIDTFIDYASPVVRRVAFVMGSLIAIGGIATVVVASARIVLLLYELDQRSDALDVPSWIPQSFIPIGLGTIALIMAIKLVLTLADARRAAPKDAR